MQQGDRETMGVYVCASARWWREHGVCKLFASRALVVAFIDGHVHLTGCNNCLTSFHEPLSLPCRCHIDLKKMPGAIIVCDFLSPSQSSLYHHFHSSSHHRLADLKAIQSVKQGGGDSSVVRAPDSWSKGCGFESLLERRENFLLQGQLSVLTLIRYPFHPCVTAVAHKRPRSFCQKCRWQVTAKHAYTLRTWLCMKWHGACLYGVRRTRRDWLSVAADSCGTSHASAVSTPLRWIFKNAL